MEKLNPKRIENILALTPMQEGMLFHYLKDPQGGLYFEQLSLEISGEIDAEIFEKAWNVVAECNEMLRTVFHWEKLEKPSQIILKKNHCRVIYYDLSGKDGNQTIATLEEIKNKDRHEAFDLHQVPFRVILCKLAEKRYEVVISNHHILYDGWSNGIILKEFFKTYHKLCNGERSTKIPAKPPFKEFLRWIQNQDRNNQEQFWKEYLAGFDTPVRLPITRINEEVEKEAVVYSVNLEGNIKDKLEIFARNRRVTLASVFYTAWGILLQKYCSSDDVVFGTTVAGRSARIKGIEDMVGLFINTIPLRVQALPGFKIIDIVAHVEKTLQVREEFEYASLVDIKSCSPVEVSGSLFDSIVAIENYPLDKRLVPGDSLLSVHSHSIAEMTHYDLTVGIIPFDDIKVNFAYHRGLFDKETVENLARHFLGIVQHAVEHPEEELYQLEILSTEEKNRILYEFNNTAVEYPEDKTIHELFTEQAAKSPDNIAVVGAAPPGHSVCLTYRELNEQSYRLAHLLIEKGVLADDIVGIMLERSIEMMIGILGILKLGGAYLPIDPDYPEERSDYMLKDSRAKLLITAGNLDDLPSYPLTFLPSYLHDSSNLAYIIYTSGSTGKSKGVMVCQRNVVRLVKNTNFVLLNGETRILQTGAPVFDATTLEIWGSLLNGGQLVLTDKETILDAHRLDEVLKKNRINTLWLSSPLFNQLMKQSIELFSSLRYLLVGGDVLSPVNINRVKQRFPGLSIINGYGPTENTTFSTTYLIEKEFEHNIPIGRPIANSTVYIYDKNNGLAPIGAVGELYVGGDGVSLGYLNNPELTAEKFNRYYRSDKTYILYKTGDLARWLPDPAAWGAYIIEFLGRIDHQVKIRGFRIELGEIENRLLSHPKVREVVVVTRESEEGEDKYLCAYIVPAALHPAETLETAELLDYLAAELPDYMLPTYFVMLEKMPLNPNGKVDRKALPEPYRDQTAGRDYVPPRDEVENILADIWSEVLGVEKKQIGIHENFFRLGGHSLKATGLAVRIHKRFDIEIPLREIFKTPTINGIALYIQKAKKSKQLPIEPIEKKEYYALSPAQERFFVFQQMEPDSVSYNIPEILRLEGRVFKEKFETVLEELIRRHESLRTSFELVDGKPVQRVHDWEEAAFAVEYNEFALSSRQLASSEIPEEFKVIEKSFIRSFDLSLFPLLRLRLVKVAAEVYFLLFDIHHIVSDGVSTGIFIEECLALYNGEKLPALTIQYKDYINWISEKRKIDGVVTGGSGAMRGGRQAEPPQSQEEVLRLPTDYVRPAVPNYEGKIIPFEIEEWEKEALVAFSLQQNTTLFMILLSAFNIFLSKLSDQDNIVVGSPMTGRQHQDLAPLIGLFINTLVLRNFPTGEKRFPEFLAEVKENTLQAFDNQQYQYERLADEIRLAANTGRNPLFDVMFVLQNMKMPPIVFPGIKVTRYRDLGWSSKFDMTLYCEEYNNYIFKLEYRTSLFKPETIQRFIVYFKKVIARIAANPELKIAEIDILPEEEKQQLVYNLNDTVVDFPQDRTIFQWFQEQAIRTPERIAVICMSQDAGNTEKMAVTYRQLQEKVNRLASFLRKRGLKANTAAGIMMERSVEAVAAILGVLTAGGVYVPIDPEYPGNRIITMLENSRAAFLLTDSGIVRKRPLDSLSRQQEILVLDKVELAEEIRRESAADLPPASAPGDLIYIIFTSGSTGTPKGAGVYHRGFMNLMHWFVSDFNLGEKDSNLWLTSLSFDLTQKNLYAPLITGGTLSIPHFNYFEPRSLLGEIHHNRVTWINCTPSMFYKLVEYESAVEEKQLTSLRYVFLGGEPIYMSVLIDWLESAECHAEIVNTYGPTECTDICNSYCIKEPREFLEQAIPVGKPIYNVQLFVTDKNLQLVPLGVPGELLIGGAGVGIGYVDDKNLTGQKFIRYSFGGEPKRLLYRTGDLVKRLPGGDVEFLGRIDHQVKIRGFRIEPGEIENRLLSRPQVKEAVVMARGGEGGDDKYLCAYIVPAAPYTVETLEALELREYLAATLPEYMIPAYFMMLEKMPLNPNGKVDRKALPEPDRTAGSNYAPPRNGRENVLVGIWSEVLGIDRKQIGINDNFFRLGGHSLRAAGLIGRIHKAFSVEVSIAELFKIPTIKGISDYIEKTGASIYLSIQPVEEKEYYPLSSAQKRLFFVHRMDPQSIAYNLPSIMKLEGKLERECFEKTFKQLIHRHESLRTSFDIIAEELVQRIRKNVEFEIEYINMEHGAWSHTPWPVAPASTIKAFVRPFDLSRPPLLRVGLLKLAAEKHLLMVDMHHIISDGISIEIFIRDFSALYSGKELAAKKLQYRDYAVWQIREQESEGLREQIMYWKKEFEGEIPVLDLPIDYVRPTVQGYEGECIKFELNREIIDALKTLGLELGITLYMELLAIYTIFLAKISSREDIVIGAPVAGRRHVDLEKIIGMFVNTLAMRNFPSGEKTFSDFLGEVKERTLNAFQNQDCQYEDLVEQVAVNRDISRNPLFDVMFVLQNMNISQIMIPGLKVAPDEYENETSKFDLTLIAVEVEEKLEFTFEYSTKLFKKETIDRFINYFINIVSLVLADKNKKISELEIISIEEMSRILYDFNNTAEEYPGDKTIHRLFEEMVEKMPDHIALIGPSISAPQQITYNELNKRSQQLAHELLQKGVAPDTIVGIISERSLEMIVSIFGILKSGGAYLPIDPEYPEERINFMLKDSGAKIMIGRAEEWKSGRVEFVVSCFFLASSLPHFLASDSSNLAYVIYTSGSTGKPKGVIVEHGPVVNLLYAMQRQYPFAESDTYLLKTSFIFDVSVTELFGWYMGGGRLAVLEKKGERDPQVISDWIEWYFVTHINFVPSMFTAFLEYVTGKNRTRLFSLKYIFLAGEALLPNLVEKSQSLGAGILLENIYGPTEGTVYSTKYPLSDWDNRSNIPIGQPLPNIQLFILGKYNHLLPIGIPGELCIAGDGLARGYLNRPELTSEKFGPQITQINQIKNKKINKSFSGGAGGLFYKKKILLYCTGDLARWLPDGNIEFLGRIDDQVKIRGFRVEIGEIENQLLRHEEILEAVVLVKEDNPGDKYLSAYFVSNRELSYTGLKEYLSKNLPDYMIPTYFTRLEALPLTSSGKINRGALPSPEAQVKEGYIPPGNAAEETLVGIWSDLLGKKKELIGIGDNFFQLGGHSLKATSLGSLVYKSFNVKIPLQEIFKRPTVRALSEYINESLKEHYRRIEKAEAKEYYPLSSAQKRLYFLQQLNNTGTVYNISIIWELEGVLDKSKLDETFIKLIERHESLRTSFKLVNEEPVQQIHEDVEFEIEYKKSSTDYPDYTDKKVQFIRSFDLAKAPLLRVGLLRVEDEKHILMVDMHHIISDGMSIQVLMQEFSTLYIGKELADIELQYKDYAEWQNREKQSLHNQEEYWKIEFEGEIPVLELPTDYERPSVQSFEGDSRNFEIDGETFAGLKALALETGATLYMSLLSLYTLFLLKITNQEDIVVGAPLAGRRHADIEKIIGMFVNTLALRNYPSGEKTFSGFLAEVKERALNAFQNQDYQYEDMVEEVVVTRDAGRNPLFDVMLVLQNNDQQAMEIPGLKLIPYPQENKKSKFDLSLIAVEAREKLLLTFVYCTKLFKPETIERFIAYFISIVSAVKIDSNKKISEVEIISPEERERLLYDFNNIGVEYPTDKSIHQMYEEQVKRAPDHIALVGMGHDTWGMMENAEECSRVPLKCIQLSYRGLSSRANRLAHLLREKGVQPETIVGIMEERSVEMIIGIMAILEAGGAYLPLSPDYPQERIDYILADSNAKILLGKVEIQKEIIVNCKLEVPPQAPYHHSSFIVHRSNHLCYIIYTSGSTGNPKGVMVEQRNVCNLVLGLKERIYYRYQGKIKVCLVAPYVFDASVKQIFGALLLGHSLHIVPVETRISGEELLDYYEKYQIDLSDGTPNHIRILTESVREPGRLPINIKQFLIGGEALAQETAARFLNNCNRGKSDRMPIISNVYGPTECCVDTTSYDITEENVGLIGTIPIGKPLPNQRVYIVDRFDKLQPVGIGGELLIGGESVSRGYLGNVESAKKNFVESPFRLNERLYRTGDLAKWLADGNIYYLGRIDRQVKIRGYRIELGEIENCLLSHNNIKEAVVIDCEYNSGGDKYLCAYIVWGDGLARSNPLEIKEFLLGKLPEYMIPSYFVELGRIPLTANGKLNRKLLPEPEIKAEGTYVAPQNPVEEKLVEIWNEVLHRNEQRSSTRPMGIDDNFFQLGGHSLKAIIMIFRINKTFHINIPLTEVFKRPTIRRLSQYIRGSEAELYADIEPAAAKEYYVLSSAQKRLYILNQMDESSTSYNMPFAVVLEGKVDKDRLEWTFKELLKRHESLRTSFEMVGDNVGQRIHKEIEFKIEYHNGGIAAVFEKPFDLSCAPLMRVGLVKVEMGKYILMVDMHHIIADGISRQILVEEFTALYRGENLPELRIQYKDFSEWQSRQKDSGEIKRQETFWREQLGKEIPVVQLPTDSPRPTVQKFEGNRLTFELVGENVASLKTLALAEGITMYIVLLSLYYLFLSKLCSQEDIVVGTPTAGRRHADLERIIGMFVNTLVLRNYPSGEKTYKGFLSELNERLLEAFENQDYQYEELVDALSENRDTSRNPLFDTMFVLQNPGIQKIEIPGLKLAPYENENKTSKFDLTLIVVEAEERLSFTFEYSTGLFKQETIKRFIRYFKTVVDSILGTPCGPHKKISEIEIISEEEKQQVLRYFNNPNAGYSTGKTLHELFGEQVGQTPDHIAVIYDNKHLSCREVAEKSSRLARLLTSKGIVAGVVVGIMVERSLEMIIGILGILKSGAAYLPINLKYPESRIKYMILDSGAKLLLTQKKLEKEMMDLCEIIDLKDTGLSDTDIGVLPRNAGTCNDYIYVIYTSGSTGKPKGVPITHSNLSQLLHWGYRNLGLTCHDRTIQNLSYFFDWSVWEIFITLTSGSSLYLTADDVMLNPDACIDFIIKNALTVLHITPTQFQYFLNTQRALGTLRYLFIGAEKLVYEVLERSYQVVNADCRVFNMYGPTEATIISAVLEIERQISREYEALSSVPIGKAVGNTVLLVLDKYMNICPVNVMGELYIAGDGLAGGYLNDPVKSDQSFIKNIFQSGGVGGEYMYKTGDLVRWLPGGEVEFFGRIDHQVKIRGYRIELGEIVNRLLAHESVREAEVIVRESSGIDGGVVKGVEKSLCAYIVVKEEVDVSMLRAHLSKELPEYMVPSYFVKIERMPLNANGKIDRKALPEPTMEAGINYTGPRNRIEEKLVEIWSGVLGIDKNSISIDSNFFGLGGHSLKVTVLAAKIQNEFNVKVSLPEIFKMPTIREIAGVISCVGETKLIELDTIEKREYYKLSYNQKRLWLINRLEPEKSSYNMAGRVELEHRVDEEIIKKTVYKLAERHESLRTWFKLIDGEPVQFVKKEIEVPLKKIDISLSGEEQRLRERQQIYSRERMMSFDLNEIPLFRFVLLKLAETHYDFIFNIHHIITDGWSMEILKKDFFLYYEGFRTHNEYNPEGLKLQYKDFAAWNNKQLEYPFRQEQSRRFWREKLREKITEFDLPVNPGGSKNDLAGAGYRCILDKDTKDKLEILAQNNRATLFIVMFSIYLMLLSRLSNREKIVCSIIAAGREYPSLQNIVGFFVNSILFSINVDYEENFIDFIQRVSSSNAELFQHQWYPIELVLKELKMKYPDVPTSFNMLNIRDDSENPVIDGIESGHIESLQDVKFDLEIYVSEYKNGLALFWAYKKSLFDPLKIESFAEEYLKLIDFFKDNFQDNYYQYKSKKKKRRFQRND